MRYLAIVALLAFVMVPFIAGCSPESTPVKPKPTAEKPAAPAAEKPATPAPEAPAAPAAEKPAAPAAEKPAAPAAEKPADAPK